jgi:hypothetical protein
VYSAGLERAIPRRSGLQQQGSRPESPAGAAGVVL